MNKEKCDKCNGYGSEDVIMHYDEKTGDFSEEHIKCSKCDGFGTIDENSNQGG